MDKDLIISILSMLNVGTLSVYIFERRKKAAETKQEESKADQEDATFTKLTQEIYVQLVKDMEEKYQHDKNATEEKEQKMIVKLETMQLQITGMKETMEKETVKYKEIKDENTQLKLKINEISEKYQTLKTQYEKVLARLKEIENKQP